MRRPEEKKIITRTGKRKATMEVQLHKMAISCQQEKHIMSLTVEQKWMMMIMILDSIMSLKFTHFSNVLIKITEEGCQVTAQNTLT